MGRTGVESARAARVRRYERGRERNVQAKVDRGGACERCGRTDVPLEWDHVQPATKVAKVSDLWSASEARYRAEVAKCVLTCRSCHVIKTRAGGEFAQRLNGRPADGVVHGLQAYKRGVCRCVVCADAKSAENARRPGRGQVSA